MAGDRRYEVAQLIYEHTRGGAQRVAATADALDAKALQLFSAATVVLGLGGVVFGKSQSHLATGFYATSLVAYAVVAALVWRIVRPTEFRVIDGADRWWPSHRFQLPQFVLDRLLDDMQDAAAHNRDELRRKARPLRGLVAAVAVEAVLVALAAAVAFA